MKKLRLISTVMVILGFISFLSSIFLNKKEFMEYGLYLGIAGLIGYGVIFILYSTNMEERKFLSD